METPSHSHTSPRSLSPTSITRSHPPFPPIHLHAPRVSLSIFSNTNLALLIWQTLSGGRDQIVNTSFGTMLCIIVATVIIHGELRSVELRVVVWGERHRSLQEIYQRRHVSRKEEKV